MKKGALYFLHDCKHYKTPSVFSRIYYKLTKTNASWWIPVIGVEGIFHDGKTGILIDAAITQCSLVLVFLFVKYYYY